jgi:hypothetical protein
LEELPTTRDGLNQTPVERRERGDKSALEALLSTIYEKKETESNKKLAEIFAGFVTCYPLIDN